MAQAIISALTPLADHTIELILDVQGVFSYIPGQRALLDIPSPIAEPVKRAYSLVAYTAEGDHSQMTMVIKIKDDGKAGMRFKQAKVGDILGVSGIYGKFVLQDTLNPKVFVGTGTGIAPLISMANTTQAHKQIFFSVSYATELFYAEKIKEIPNCESHIHVSREEVAGCEMGRIDLSKTDFPKESEFYICGSPESVGAFATIVKERGYDKIYTEKY